MLGDETELRPALTLSPRQQTEYCTAAKRRSVPIAVLQVSRKAARMNSRYSINCCANAFFSLMTLETMIPPSAGRQQVGTMVEIHCDARRIARCDQIETLAKSSPTLRRRHRLAHLGLHILAGR